MTGSKAAFAGLSHPKCAASDTVTKELARKKAMSPSVSVQIDGDEQEPDSGLVLARSYLPFESGVNELALTHPRCGGDVLDLWIISDTPLMTPSSP